MNIFLLQEGIFLPARRQAGLSLVELMVSLTIGMFLLMGLTTLIVQQSSTRTELEKSSRQIENGRYAMQLLHDDLQLAGFYGEYSPASDAATTYSTPDPCSTGDQGWATTPVTVPVPVFGYPGADPNPACVTNREPGTAILVVRRTATEPEAGAAVAGTNYLQVSRCNLESIPFVMASAVAAFTLQTKACDATPSAIRKYMVRIYYIASCDVCAPSSDGIPTLKMVEFVDGAQSAPIPLVEGIENMQFEYGLDNVGAADGAPDSYTTAPAGADWSNVVAVRVSLLARNTETTAGHVDKKTYVLASGVAAIGPKNDNYKRHAYSELTRVVNVSSRRETP